MNAIKEAMAMNRLNLMRIRARGGDKFAQQTQAQHLANREARWFEHVNNMDWNIERQTRALDDMRDALVKWSSK